MSFPSGNITEDDAREHCLKLIFESDIGELCSNYTDFDDEIQGCMEDIKVSHYYVPNHTKCDVT